MTQDLTNLRTKITKLDDGILSLLDERMKLSLEIGEYKRKHSLNVLDQTQEEALLKRLLEANQQTVIPDEKLVEIWGKIIELSRDLQRGN